MKKAFEQIDEKRSHLASDSFILGYNEGRYPARGRLDLRFDRRVHYQDWIFEFYVDIVNAFVSREDVMFEPERAFRYALPTFGVRARL